LKNNVTNETQQINGVRKIMNMTVKGYFRSVQTPRSFLNTVRLIQESPGLHVKKKEFSFPREVKGLRFTNTEGQK
jgi:hypothetical protein